MTFQDLGLCPELLSALKALGYEKPSPIQEKAIPPALKGRDVLGCAQTGTGKTCAFAAPILQQLKQRPGKGRPIRALILTPTRELALQIQESFEHYGKNLSLRSAVIFGGVGQQPQVDKLKAGVDILVATPGRLEDLHNQGFIHVENLEIFVLDEADRMLDMGFIHDVKKILTWLPKKKQTLFFSATMPPEVQGLVDQLLTDPVKVAVDPVSSPVEAIDQKLYYVDRGNKSKLLAMLVKGPEVKSALVFTRTKHGANKVAGDLQKAGVASAAIHGNKSQTARQQALADFKTGRVKALVATDIAARGIDIEELSHVFNYNLPDVPETYVHRIGRTGRAGHGGAAISFCEFGEKELLAPIEKLLKKPIPVVEGHPFPMENFEAPKRDKHGKIVNADDAEARQAARERKAKREHSCAPADGLERGRATPPKGAKTSPSRREAAGKSAANASVTPPRSQQSQPPQSPQGGRDIPKAPSSPRAVQPPQGGRRTSPAQTSAAGKRKAAGYKPSKTLDEALTAVAPGGMADDPAKAAAFAAWMAEEQAIQARYYHDALAGEEVMDATARLLAPKGSGQKRQTPPARPETSPKRGQRPAGPSSKQEKRADKPQKSRQSAPKRSKSAQPPKDSRPAPKRPAPAPKQGARKNRSDRRGRPMEVTLRLGSQKDSTEQQGSLMRPYYFNPEED